MKLNDSKIRTILYEKGITQIDVARRAGLGRSTVVNVCNGKSCSLKSAVKIANVLGVSVDDLIKK